MCDYKKMIEADLKRLDVGGFAQGDYNCHCCECGVVFLGDKRSVTCPACAYQKRIVELESVVDRVLTIAQTEPKDKAIFELVRNVQRG